MNPRPSIFKKAPIPENAIVKSCLDYLSVMQIFAWRNNTGVARPKRADGSFGFVKFGYVGSSDIFALHDGRFIAIECKAEKGRLSQDQISFLDRVRFEGGIAIVARSVDDLAKGLKEAKVI